MRAIECDKAYGHAAQPWTTWAILSDLENAVDNLPAAQATRQQAIVTFLAYRQEGGENHDGAGRLALAVYQAIQQGEITEMAQVISKLLNQSEWQAHKTYLQRLQAILVGERHADLAEDDAMPYDCVVELKILLAQLGK